jgi:hypothetical protein
MQLGIVSQIDDYGQTDHFNLSFGNSGNNYHIAGINDVVRMQILFFYDIYFHTFTMSMFLWDSLSAKIVIDGMRESFGV